LHNAIVIIYSPVNDRLIYMHHLWKLGQYESNLV